MKQVAIISGKGGTGKTLLTACFAALMDNKVLADCDVDAANLHLLLPPEIQEPHSFFGLDKAKIDPEKCTGCGECVQICRFDAVSKILEGEFLVDRVSCEGCRVCSLRCPPGAIRMEKAKAGEWYVSRTSYGSFVHARLGIGEENSGKLVTEVRKNAKDTAEKNGRDLVILDGPPGTGCPVIASLTGADLALVVTEPTPSGIHDMKRAVQVAHHFGVRTACCTNKYDLNISNSGQIQEWCEKESIPFLGKIPYDESVSASLLQGIPFVEYADNSTAKAIKKLPEQLTSVIYE